MLRYFDMTKSNLLIRQLATRINNKNLLMTRLRVQRGGSLILVDIS
jgi:hypothetical protein